MNTRILFIALFCFYFGDSVAMKKGRKAHQRNQLNAAKSAKGSHNIRRLNINKINANLEENEFNGFDSNIRPSGSMNRMMGKKSTISSSGSGVASFYDDDFFHNTDDTSGTGYSGGSTSSSSTDVFNAFRSDGSTLGGAMKTVLWSGMIVGAGFLMFSLFLAVAIVVRKVKNRYALADKREPLADDDSVGSSFVVIE